MLRRLDPVLQNPTALVGLLAAGQVVAWTLAPTLSHSAPPIDVVESTMWGREWVLATYKHPAMPSWVLEAARLATGVVGWPAYLVSQLFVAATFLFVFLLGRAQMGAERAAAGTLLLTGVAYFAWPTTEFNHNIAETPFWAALAWALWQAVERGGIGRWLLVGALAAAGLYAKLSTGLLLAAMAGWMLWDARTRAQILSPGPWLALAAFLLLAAPLAHWLLTHAYGPLHHAAARSLQLQGSQHGLVSFASSVAANLAGLLAMLAICGLLARRRSGEGAVDAAPAVDARVVRYLAVLTAGPLALALLAALASGTGLKAAWGSSMFNLAGLLAVALAARRFTPQALARIAACAAVALLLVPAGYAAVVAYAPARGGVPVRAAWPQAEISARLAGTWRRETGRPLRIVTGDTWIAGLVGVGDRDLPSILTNGEMALSPWITPQRLAREGVLVVWNARAPGLPDGVRALIAERPARVERFAWTRSRSLGELEVAYVIVPPR